MKVLRHTHTTDADGNPASDYSYQVLEATSEEEAELMSQPPGTANDWIENNPDIEIVD